QAAVDQLRRRARRARGEVRTLDEPHGEPALGGERRRRGADDAAADDQQVEPLPLDAVEAEGAFEGRLRHDFTPFRPLDSCIPGADVQTLPQRGGYRAIDGARGAAATQGLRG